MNFSFTTHDGKPIRETSVGQVRVSVGYASYPEETANADELMDLADKRMYEVKERRAGVKASRSDSRLSSLPDLPGSTEGRVLSDPPLRLFRLCCWPIRLPAAVAEPLHCTAMLGTRR